MEDVLLSRRTRRATLIGRVPPPREEENPRLPKSAGDGAADAVRREALADEFTARRRAEEAPREGAAQDITERKQVEEKLRDSLTLLAEAEALSSTGAWEWDLVRDRWRFSDEWLAIHGCSDRHLSSEDLLAIAHPDDEARIAAAFEQVRDGSGPYDIEHRIVRRDDGEIRVIHARGKLVRDENGEPWKVLGAAQDITERKQAEEERRLDDQRQYRRKLKSLRVVASGVAHDFNNELTAMLGNSELALSELSPEHPAHSIIEKVIQTAQRAASLSRQMGAYAGGIPPAVRTTDLSALVRENIQQLTARVPKGVELRTDLPKIAVNIEADAGQVQQVLVALVTNAGEAMGEMSGSVTISTGFEILADEDDRYSRFTTDDLDGGEYAFLEVHDEGSGMSAATLASVFDPFFTTKFLGRGLGLAALLGIVRGHRGGVAVKSEMGAGATFRVVIPTTEMLLERVGREMESRSIKN